MAVLFSLITALGYGVSDFVGGVLSRRSAVWPVAVAGGLGGLVGAVVLAGAVPGTPTLADNLWGALGGLGSGIGVGYLYRGLAAGRMGVVAPVSALGATLVPVLTGLLLGERPSLVVWTGFALALPGVWLVSREPADDPVAPADLAAPAPGTRSPQSAGSVRAAGLVDGVIAGVGFGMLFAVTGQIPRDAGLWPVVSTQAVALVTLVSVAVLSRSPWRPRGIAWWAIAAGSLGSLALWSFLTATSYGLLTVSSVLASFYPGVTVLLAALLLRERIHPGQGVGLALCAATIILVALG